MYIPKPYKKEDKKAIRKFLQENSFGILINQNSGKLWGTHIPLELEVDNDGNDFLVGHLSRANPQWKSFDANDEVLAIFQGPHSYVSSSWYNFEEVPTWNYIAVHVYGQIEIIEGEELMEVLKRLIDKYEKKSACPIAMEELSATTLSQVKGIVGFKIKVNEIHASYKLSQKMDDTNFYKIIENLEESSEPNSVEIAKEMKKTK